VEEVLQQIRSGVRQRQAERAANRSARQQTEERGQRWEQIDQRITELQARVRVQERPFVSHAPVVGRLIVFIRQAWNNVAARWFVLPMVHQQNAFNQTVVQAFRELIHVQDQLSVQLNETRRHLDARMDETSRYLEQIEERLIGSDRDVTLLARKIAEREYQVRQWDRRAAEERAELARHLERLEKILAALESNGVVE
jgi:uncharacterized protein YqgV (UPF0045/DUF77 family)